MGLRGVAIGSVLVALCAAPSALATTGPSLAVNAGAERHAISPYIYGWNFAPAAFAKEVDLPIDRRGGNSADTLNWQTGVENHSSDYFFENLPTCWADCPAGWDPARSYTDQIGLDRDAHAQTLLDLPMLGIVPKDMGDNNAVYCSYSVAKYGDQKEVDPYDNDCGNGLDLATGNPIANDPADTGVQKGPEFQGAWIDSLKSRYGDAANGGVGFYELGNEPGLWNSTHVDWHPDAVTYDELGDKSLALAEVVKSHDPTAKVVGFSEWGWPNFFCSAADDTSDGCQADDVDRGAHNGTPIAEWLLQQFKAYADAHGGQRLLDYFDVHYYRQDDRSSGIAATRSLWDPNYTDPSWINDKIRMIPRMHEWVDQNYPGTKLAFTEYDLAVDEGADDTHIDLDNLIEADTLGIFAREGLDLATLWPETANLGHYEDAFRLYRNYDGQHSKFGDTFVSSQSGDQGQLSIYGATRSSDGALTLAVINKTASDLTSTIALTGFAAGGVAQVWTWTGTASGIKLVAAPAVDANGLTHTFPGNSMSMVVVPAAPVAPSDGQATAPQSQSPTTTPLGSHAVLPAVTRCVVPKLKGLTLAKAKKKLKKAHCRLGKTTKKKSRVRKGRVIAQTPKPGKKLRNGSKVAVVLSRGR